MRANKYLIDLYLDWFNNWLTVAAFSEYHNISEKEALDLIRLGRWMHEKSVNPLSHD